MAEPADPSQTLGSGWRPRGASVTPAGSGITCDPQTPGETAHWPLTSKTCCSG